MFNQPQIRLILQMTMEKYAIFGSVLKIKNHMSPFPVQLRRSCELPLHQDMASFPISILIEIWMLSLRQKEILQEIITVFFRLYDALDHKTHLGFRGGKQEKKIFETKTVVLLLPPVTPLHCCPTTCPRREATFRL